MKSDKNRNKIILKIPKYVKWIAIVFLIFSPVLLIMLIFSPLTSRRSSKSHLRPYRLSENLDRESIGFIIDKMREDQEFQFYFFVLDPEHIDRISGDIFHLLSENRDKSFLLYQIEQLKKAVNSMKQVFDSVEFPEDYFENPALHPELNQLVWQFLLEDFKLTVLGLCYKATYDTNFALQWDKKDQSFAQKLITIYLKLKQGDNRTVDFD
ncbi:MAG TPA: hypothetical protein DD723_08825 [Candidatus Omnitrophica bacterium]|nr:MAG: hypothetical protein A2Z81_08425 [Omnitrophica WOR_2 bacterium GWA2_45_18]OGX19373.1 MAG: hypothetical protein A2Y04_02050 [Omnitrophica WOR_2 bacterium GWC2_45_7]HBR15620.1 hypothetical protein [Candidatus Omnitrophota bacterium]